MMLYLVNHVSEVLCSAKDEMESEVKARNS
jgi:hypothetical protein